MSDKTPLIAFSSRAGINYVGGDIVDLPVGNTDVAAGLIRDRTKGDLFKVEPVKSSPAGYQETTEVAKTELREGVRPELTGRVADMAPYEVVCLGYPNGRLLHNCPAACWAPKARVTTG